MNTVSRLSLILLMSSLVVACSSRQPVVLNPKGNLPPRATLSSPVAGSKVSSPVTIIGTAPGTWFSEGQLPVEIVSSDGTRIVLASATAQDEWMTEKQVPFQVVVPFQTTSLYGAIIVRKDNPSGLPENDDSFAIGVTF